MKNIFICFVLLIALTAPTFAQTPPRSSLSGYCSQGGQKVTLAGMQSTSKVIASYPLCTVAVYSTDSYGVQSGTYTSGGSAAGNAGTLCTVTFIGGGGTSATATIALSALNTLSVGTPLTISSPATSGTGYTSAPTTATLSTNTATCSGTASVSTAIGLNKAVLYSDDSGSTTSNPLTSDANGFYQFYTNDGRYDLTFSGTGITSPITLSALPLSSPPRHLTTAQRTAISSPYEGLTVYDITLHKLYTYEGSNWQASW